MVGGEENGTERAKKRDHSPSQDRTEASGNKRAREVVEYEEVCVLIALYYWLMGVLFLLLLFPSVCVHAAAHSSILIVHGYCIAGIGPRIRDP